ncbi:Hypothetical predicted protein, partial [Paramuricea clavata]
MQGVEIEELTVSSSEKCIVDNEITKLLMKGLIEPTNQESGEFISTIFLRPKKDGTFRVILNLKRLNEFVEYHHFKMDTIYTAIHLMKQGCFMASIDLQDAYYTVPVCPNHRKYLKFSWRGQLYQYSCLPNGLASAPRIFTKILKPVYASLRNKGHISFAYIDDSYLQDDNFEGCKTNVHDTTTMFDSLGFIPPSDQLFYRALERDKTQALKLQKGNYAANMTLSQDALADLRWWIYNIETSSKPVLASQPDMVIQSDASLLGWGAHSDGKHAGGPWGETEAKKNIWPDPKAPVNKSFAKDPGGISRGEREHT